MEFTKAVVDNILDIVPAKARACYTGQSILAYVDNPTFTYEELNCWESQTDVDMFCYNNSSQATIVQAYLSAGWYALTDIDEFKSDRIRFWEPNRKFNLQTVMLTKEDQPTVNISWAKHVEDVLDCVKRFDMDFLMVGMDLRTGTVADLRPSNPRLAHVNPFHSRFDPVDVEPSFWYRQFERCPKCYSRGVDTRPVAQQYKQWIEHTLEVGDKTLHSKTQYYKNKAMDEAIAPVIEAGFTEQQAKVLYKLFTGEQNNWEAARIKHEAMLSNINDWLALVEED